VIAYRSSQYQLIVASIDPWDAIKAMHWTMAIGQLVAQEIDLT